MNDLLDHRTVPHLERLEAESTQVMREAVAECDRPVMLYSIGKDSAVMLHLALKAFYPAKLPFPLLHVDTGSLWMDTGPAGDLRPVSQPRMNRAV